MNINEALEKTWRILEEEEVQPTLGYRYVSNAWPTNRRYQQNDYFGVFVALARFGAIS